MDNQHLISPSRPFTLETVAFRHGEFSNPLENQDELNNIIEFKFVSDVLTDPEQGDNQTNIDG
ncbi:hypothetical protein Bca52824_047868 [Brassica carinata]|uniref:Uncharacterized protein n=1 Tax=Brassica carinata TaxID=52824 RepID=A0A8X7RMM6_BRACI|nr:hypothetical protein Bca52824_047868 [Brassica carinata]